jgi:hypothetical protein
MWLFRGVVMKRALMTGDGGVTTPNKPRGNDRRKLLAKLALRT